MVNPNHPTQSDRLSANQMPDWLATRYQQAVVSLRAKVKAEAHREARPIGVAADRRIRAILDAAGGTGKEPTSATLAAYRRDYERLCAEALTPLEKASTFQHHNRLRSAFRYCEREAIRDLRARAERARREKRRSDMERLTLEALDRAAVFEAMFLDPDRPTWGGKAAALRAAGSEQVRGKSKRAAGRRAPTPDQLLCALSGQPGRAARVEIPTMCFALFGVRPAELLKGARIIVEGEAISLLVEGAKVDSVRGQKFRKLTITGMATASSAGFGKSLLAVSVLRRAATDGKGWVKISAADLAAVRRAMREIQPGLSPYAYRHARASDAKASGDRAMVAAWMGHANDRSQSGYGSGRSSSGAVKVEAAQGARPVRTVKTLPESLAVRLVRLEATKHGKIAARGVKRAPGLAKKQPRIRGPRLG